MIFPASGIYIVLRLWIIAEAEHEKAPWQVGRFLVREGLSDHLEAGSQGYRRRV